MSALTLVFVLVYVAALVGWLQPLPNEQTVMRLEPVIFILIGYYFGRLPSQQHEKGLKEEIVRQTQRADAAQHVKEQAQQEREALEEKVKGARAALSAGAQARPAAGSKADADGRGKEEAARHSIETALHVLDA